MNDPCTIRDAIRRFSQEKGKRLEVDGRTEITYSSGFSVDMIAVVVRLSVRRSDPPAAEVWIADQSLEAAEKGEVNAMITLFGSRAVNAILEKDKGLTVGHIVRFNGVSLRRKMVKEFVEDQEKRVTTYEFVHSWDTPGVGHPFFLIGSTNTEASVQNAIRSIIPESMETRKVMVQALVEWYPTSRFFNTREGRLPSIPCQRRSLEEMASSLGIISHVMVDILSMETIAEKKSPLKKKRRLSTPRKLHIATVADGGHNRIAFVHNYNQLVPVLQKAFDAKQPVMLHNVVCRKGREAPSWLSDHQRWDDEIVLMSTSTSYVALLPRESALSSSKNQSGITELDQTQPFLTATQYSQQQPSAVHQDASSSVVEAPLYAIEYHREKLTKDHRAWSSQDKVVSLLLQANGRAYHNAVLHLDHGGKQQGVRTIKVHADASGMQGLCCGQEAYELQKSSKLKKHVVDFLQGLLEDKVMLRWKLCRDTKDGEYRLEKVTLVELL